MLKWPKDLGKPNDDLGRYTGDKDINWRIFWIIVAANLLFLAADIYLRFFCIWK